MRLFAAILLGGGLLATPTLGQEPPAQTPAAPPAQEPPAQAPAAKAPAAKAPAAKAPTAKAPEYDPKAEVTIKGVVEEIHESKTRGDHPGLHFVLALETEKVEVHACPVRFLSELEFTVEKGDSLTVLGSRPEAGGIVVAREITKGQTSLILREKTGAPIWTGR
jgi:hypothetical protein